MSQHYNREFKIEAVRLSYQKGRTVTQTARELGMSKSALYRWRAEYRDEPEAAFPGKGKMAGKDAEIAQLKRKLREAEMEVEILKKATRCSASASSFARENR